MGGGSVHRLVSFAALSTLAAGCGCGFSSTGPGPVPASIRIRQNSPYTVTLGIDTERLTADVVDSAGVLITSQVRIAWSSADTTVVQVDQTGTLKPRRGGSTTVRASVGARGTAVQDSIVVDVGVQVPLSSAPSSATR